MKKLVLFFILCTYGVVSFAQYSTLDMFRAHKGTDVLIRTDYSRTYFVTHFYQTGMKCYFIVQQGDTIKYINLLQAYENGTLPTLKYGYEINDMQILGQECYFCGRKWQETGNYFYSLDGTFVAELEYTGIIGRFNVMDVIQNGGNYEIMEIDTTQCLNKLAVLSGRFLATGTLFDGYTPCLVDIREVTYVGPFTDCNYRVLKSQFTDEWFTDVTATFDKFIVVSRYNNPLNTNNYNYLFGLRYGNGINYYQTNTGIYNYNTQNVIPNEGASFVTNEPVLITSTNTNDEAVVAYINRKLSNRQGFPIFYKISLQGLSPSKTLIALDNVKYKTLREIKYNRPLYATSRMAVLLEDSNDYSVLRFPDWNIIGNWYDTMLTTNAYKLQSIAPFQYTSGSLELRTAGYNPNNSNRVVQLFTYDIHGYLGRWSSRSCIPSRDWSIEEIRNATMPVSFTESSLSNFHYKSHIDFTSVSFTPRNVTKTNLCTNY